jgi:regulator of nonsense transcripts 2
VTRPEEELDPEFEADFDRDLAKMMTDSIDARKFERKTLFDVPLPIRKSQREATEQLDEAAPVPETGVIKFALLSKRGNKQQV